MFPLLAALLGGLSGAFSFWEIFSFCCVLVAVTIADIITTVLTKYKVDRDGITVNVSRKSKQLVPWSAIKHVEISRIRRYSEYYVEFKSDDITIVFNTTLGIIDAIIGFSKDCDTFNKLFSESVEKAKKIGTSADLTDKEQLPDARDTKIFLTDDERKAFGGTGFYEIQYCMENLPVKKLLCRKNVNRWLPDSLYIEALTAADKFFNDYYDKIFGQFGGLYYDGVNYFTKEQTQKIICDLKNQDLPDTKILINWLEVCVNSYNGFYFLGV